MFIQFDIIDFYLYITEDLLMNDINLAQNYCDISDKEIKIITLVPKAMMYHKMLNTPVIKKTLHSYIHTKII